MTREQVQTWLDAYIDAWMTYDEAAIEALFTAEATYAYHPYDDPIRGREAIVAAWTSERDELGSWEAGYAPLLIEGNRVVATGETRYADGRRYSNLFVMTFDDDGCCREFVEWYVRHPD